MSAWILRTFSTRGTLPLLTLFKSLVRSKIDYCCPVWFPAKKEDICSLEAIQRSFTAKIYSLKDLGYWERLERMKLMSIQRRRERYIIIHTYKLFIGSAPNDVGIRFYWNDRLGPMSIVPKLNAKSKAIQTLQFNFFSSMGPMLFNIIPRVVKEAESVDSFKVALDDFLMAIPDTPPTPGYTAANSNSLLDWMQTNGRALPEVLS